MSFTCHPYEFVITDTSKLPVDFISCDIFLVWIKAIIGGVTVILKPHHSPYAANDDVLYLQCD